MPLLQPTRVNQIWMMDFTEDALASGRKLRTLNLMDGYTREAPAIEVDTSLPVRSKRHLITHWNRDYNLDTTFIPCYHSFMKSGTPLRSILSISLSSSRFSRFPKIISATSESERSRMSFGSFTSFLGI